MAKIAGNLSAWRKRYLGAGVSALAKIMCNNIIESAGSWLNRKPKSSSVMAAAKMHQWRYVFVGSQWRNAIMRK